MTAFEQETALGIHTKPRLVFNAYGKFTLLDPSVENCSGQVIRNNAPIQKPPALAQEQDWGKYRKV